MTLRDKDKYPYDRLVAALAPNTPAIVCRDVTQAEGALRAFAPDIGIVCGFVKIPSSLLGIPTSGLVNLHCSLLPRYRGPNPFRSIFNGDTTIGATVHQVTDRIDGGPIFGQSRVLVPREVAVQDIMTSLDGAMEMALEEGVTNALRGEPGIPQDSEYATYGGPFTPAERDIDWGLDARETVCRIAGLAMAGLKAYGIVNGSRRALLDARVTNARPSSDAQERSLASLRGRVVVAVGDGSVELVVGDEEPRSEP